MSESLFNLISVVITFHNEGILAHKTLLGLDRLRRYANQSNVEVEFILVLDSVDNETARVVKFSPVIRDTDQILEVTHQDLGSSRNSGISAAHGHWVCVFDGDDYCSENWLVAALETLNSKQSDVVVHPDYTVSFGAVFAISQSLDMDNNPGYPIANCFAVHPWTSSSFAKREIYLKYPYLRTDSQKTGFGFEDWHWNLEILAHGVRHVSAPNTALFYRRKFSSLLVNQINDKAIVRPSKFFEKTENWVSSNEDLLNHLPDEHQELHKRSFIISQLRSVWRQIFLPILHKLPKRHRSLLFKLIEQAKPRQIQEQEQKLHIQNWIVNELRSISVLEFDLYPTPSLLARFVSYTPPIILGPGKVYMACCSIISDFQPDIIFVIPWLVPGGADLGILHHVNAALAAKKKVLVISTLNIDSPWKNRLPQQVKFIEFNEIELDLSEDQKVSVVTRIIMQSPCKVIHIINSRCGWEMLKQHGKSILALKKRIFVSVYCDAKGYYGEPISYSTYFVDCLAFIHGVIIDTHWYRDNLKSQYGMLLDKVFTVYFPTILKHNPIYRSVSAPRIIWASRITPQKRIDLLIKIARLMPNIEFDVYGYAVGDYEKILENEMREIPNITVHGVYDSFESIVSNNSYCLFLYTSEWDGLPNILLEATIGGLPVVASSVGGIPDFISEQTGYPVIDLDNPSSYVQRINEAFADDINRHTKWEAAVALIMSRHTEDYFTLQLNRIPGYLND